jgi:DNA-binding transcriptional MocR family regulator
MLSDDGSFYYDDKRLAEETGVNDKTIKRAKKFLKDAGYMNIANGKHRAVATKYWILRKPDKKSPFVDISKPDNLPVMDDKMSKKGCQNVTPNNIKNKEINNKERYLDFVQLTKKEYDSLCDQFGQRNTDYYIERLNDYIGAKGEKYDSHYHVIHGWYRRDHPEERPKRQL